VVLCTAWVLAPRGKPAPQSAPEAPGVAGSAQVGEEPASVVVWPAHVERSVVEGVAEGTACQVSGELLVHDAPVLRRVRVTCGGRVLYQSLPEPSNKRSLVQRYGKDQGTIVFQATYQDSGLVPPSLRMPVDTRSAAEDEVSAHLVLGFTGNDALGLRVKRTSLPWKSAPLGAYARAAFDGPARIRKSFGRRGTPVGTVCRLQVIPAGRQSCDVTVDCGAAWSGSFPAQVCNAREAAQGEPLTIARPEKQELGVPALHFDGADSPFTITSRVPDTWMLELTLPPKMD
jgi:hypothetical protein